MQENNKLTEFILPKGQFSYRDITGTEVDLSTGKLLLGVDFNTPGKPVNALDAFFQKQPEVEGIGLGKPLWYADRKNQFSQLDPNPKEVHFWFGEYELIVYNSYPRFQEIVTMLRA